MKQATLIRALRLFGKAQRDNRYLYFELAFTHVTDWMAWMVDKSKKATDPKMQSEQGFEVLAKGQSDDPCAAVEPVLKKLEAMGYQ